MSEYNKEDIKNLHYNNVNEIQYEYGGQIYHCSMKHLKEILVTCWNLQQENQKYKELIDKLKEWINIVQQNKDNKHLEPFISTDELDELLDMLKEVSE